MLQTLRTVVAELDAAVGVEPVAAIGITDQRETVVAWDRRTGQPSAPAIVWQDRRTGATLRRARRQRGTCRWCANAPGSCSTRTSPAPRSSGSSPRAASPVDDDLAIGTIDAWLLWNLTGGDGARHRAIQRQPHDALRHPHAGSGRRAVRPVRRARSPALPEVRPVERALRRRPRRLDGRARRASRSAGIAGDQQAALFGQACFAPGMTKNTYGTGSFVLMNVGRHLPRAGRGPAHHRGLDVRRPTAPTHYALEGAIFVTGAAVQWLRDGLGIIDDAAEVGPLAASVDDTDGVFVVPAFTGLGSPWWDPYARGTVVGITRGTGPRPPRPGGRRVDGVPDPRRGRRHGRRQRHGRSRDLRADGGASAMDLLLQLQADQLGVPVRRPVVQETTALGAAYLAGLAEGVWLHVDDIAARWADDAEFTPAADRTGPDAHHAGWLHAVERSRAWPG